jgi:esterase/lipase superfamily enzyme
MVTNRKKNKSGEYTDEEQSSFKFDYLYDFDESETAPAGFHKSGKRGFEDALLRELIRIRDEEGINTPKVGIYLHGYNNDYQDSIDEVYDLEKSLTPVVGYAPVIVGFSWPSSGSVPYYLSDREEARDSVGAFTRFLRDINNFVIKNERECFSTTYCIAHSMGNYLLRKGMEYLSDYLGTPTGRLLFNETVLMAPDLASKDIEMDGKGSYIADFSRRVHVYYSQYDRALKASSVKRFGGNRLGRHGADDYTNLANNVVVINAEKYANSDATKDLRDRRDEPVSVHSSHRYHESILADVVQVLSSVDRGLIPNRNPILPDEELEPFLDNHYELM